MGRTKGRTGSDFLTVPFAVPAGILRPITGPDDLRPGEVLVQASPRPKTLTKLIMPLSKPSDLAFEVWRLVRHEHLTYGQVATTSKVAKHLAPHSRATDPHASRVALAKKYKREVDDFLRTPIGQVIKRTPAFKAWIKSGVDPSLLQIVPFPGHRPDATFHENMVDYRDYLRHKRGNRHS